MSEAKTKPTSQPAAEFIATLPEEQRRADCSTLMKLMQKASGAPPVMWGAAIVGFGKYPVHYANGKQADWPIIAFSPRKNDLTLYLMPGSGRYDELLQKLGKHKASKACLYIKRLSDVDMKVLGQMIVLAVDAMADKRTG